MPDPLLLKALTGSLCLAVALLALPASAADWLIDPSPFKASIVGKGQTITLQNGLVSRVLRISPNAATISLKRLDDGTEFVRAVQPEAVIELDGVKFPIGGLDGQPVHNYLDPRWLETMTANPAAFRYKSHRIGQTVERFAWKKRGKWMPTDVPWPPPGKSLTLTFAAPQGGVTVDVHYEIYDGLPLISKWIVVRNGTDRPVRLNTFVCELLAVVESESIVDDTTSWRPSNLFVETDYTFGGMSGPNHSAGVHWVADPVYATQVNYNRRTPCLLECRPPMGPDQMIPPGAAFESFRAFVMPLDSTERERQTLAVRRMYRTVAPWVTENPILMHVRSAAPDAVRLAIDQCAAVGFEMVILTFGSGFDFESREPAYQKQIKELADYAHGKGIALGGYSLLASRGAADKRENTLGSPARYGVMPCLGAQWGVDYLAQLKRFIEVTGLDVLEHDGSYPGDQCAATDHPYHRGIEDSQWVMWSAITEFYQWCRGNGTYLNIPDWYFLNGATKTAMGYRETNWSLPREFQEIIERQNIFDGTWDKTPSMGWMFVPLTEYQGGGAAATIEPLKEHLQHYEQRLANLFGAGVQACFRGPRLFDAPETEALVKKWVDFYKRHRAILDSDIVHLRRADGRDLDYLLHINPTLKERGLLMVYNPLEHPVTRTLKVPLYYTGIRGTAKVLDPSGKATRARLDANHTLSLSVTVPARGTTYRVFE